MFYLWRYGRLLFRNLEVKKKKSDLFEYPYLFTIFIITENVDPFILLLLIAYPVVSKVKIEIEVELGIRICVRVPTYMNTTQSK